MKTRLLFIFALTILLSAFTQMYSQDYYPLNDGDFWEYFEIGGNEMGSSNSYPYSVSREVMGDTLMDNGITYKIIKWDNMANYFPEHPVYIYPFYEFQRKDTLGNIYIYYNNEDYLFLDLSKKDGDVYASHLPGWNWVVDEDPVDHMGKSWPGIGFRLIDSNQTCMRTIFCAPNIGPTSYSSDIIYFYDNEGVLFGYTARQFNYWGSIIRETENGYLLAKEQKINWSDFYPLHVGDKWVYDVTEWDLNYTKTYERIVEITNDSIMPDGNRYYNRANQYVRLDSLGNVWAWNIDNNNAEKILKFSAALGDIYDFNQKKYIISYKNFNAQKQKYYYWTGYIDSVGFTFIQGVGLTLSESYIYNKIEKLKGSVISGALEGDTTFSNKIISIEIKDKENNTISTYALDQNYPNPFNPATNITFQLPKESFVSLVVYNMLGEKVETLLNEYRGIGKHTVTFNAHNLPSGIYFYTLQTNGLTETKKMLLLK